MKKYLFPILILGLFLLLPDAVWAQATGGDGGAGTGGSGGVWEPNVNEPADGADFIRWANGLSWVESLGYWGCSYLAATGWAITGELPEKVKSMLLTHYGTERFTLEADYAVAAYDAQSISAKKTVQLSKMSESDLEDLFDDIESEAEDWARDLVDEVPELSDVLRYL